MTVMGSENIIVAARRKKIEPRKRKYRSPHIITLPPPSEFLLAQSLAELAKRMVRNDVFRKRIITATETVQTLLMKYSESMMGSFSKSLVRLRAAIKTLPSEDVDPEYYSIMEDGLMDKFEALQARIIEALAWERRIVARKADPVPGAADVKVVADQELEVLTILINEHKTNLDCLVRDVIDMRTKIKKAIDEIDKIDLPEPMKTVIYKSLQQINYCISLEASIPYKLKKDVEEFLNLLLKPYPLDAELESMVKMLKVKANNCMADSNREHDRRMDALKHIEGSLDELDAVLAETKRAYWMLDIPDVFDHRKRAFKSELSAYTATMKKKFNIQPQEENLGCVCYRTRKDRKSAREVPLCPQLLRYTEEVRKRMNIQPFRKDGSCYCSWLFDVSDCGTLDAPYDLPLRQYTTHIKSIAKAHDVVKDITCCFCYWMKLQRAFGGQHRDVCFSADNLGRNNALP